MTCLLSRAGIPVVSTCYEVGRSCIPDISPVSPIHNMPKTNYELPLNHVSATSSLHNPSSSSQNLTSPPRLRNNSNRNRPSSTDAMPRSMIRGKWCLYINPTSRPSSDRTSLADTLSSHDGGMSMSMAVIVVVAVAVTMTGRVSNWSRSY